MSNNNNQQLHKLCSTLQFQTCGDELALIATPLFHLSVCSMCKQMGFWPKRGSSAQALQEQSHTFKCGGQRCVKPTHVSSSRLDDDGSTAPGLLLGLSHALPGFLVGVVCGAYRDFVLDPSEAVQLYAPFTGQKPSLSDTPNGTDYATFSPVMNFKCVAMAHLQPRWLDGRPLKGNTCREVPYGQLIHPETLSNAFDLLAQSLATSDHS